MKPPVKARLVVKPRPQGGRRNAGCGFDAPAGKCPQPITHVVDCHGTALTVGCEFHCHQYVAGYRGEAAGSLGARMTAAGATRGKPWVNKRPDGSRIAPSRAVSGPQEVDEAIGHPEPL